MKKRTEFRAQGESATPLFQDGYTLADAMRAGSQYTAGGGTRLHIVRRIITETVIWPRKAKARKPTRGKR